MVVVTGRRRARPLRIVVRFGMADRKVAERIGSNGEWTQRHGGNRDDL
jgi:hypothetical protein